MNAKLKNNVDFSKKELLLISLLCFMNSEKGIENRILNSAEIITNIDGLDHEIGQFAKGVILLLCDKFVDDESLNTTISNLVGGNMKIVEDYAQRKVDEVKEDFEKKLEDKDKELNAMGEAHVRELKAKDDQFNNSKRNCIINLNKEGFGIEDIARLADVSVEFVVKTLG